MPNPTPKTVILRDQQQNPLHPQTTATEVAFTPSAGQETTVAAQLLAIIAGMNALTSMDVLQFKGIVNADADIAATAYKVGWFYKVNTAGTYRGHVCEPGDSIYCISSYSESAQDTDWAVLQANIIGAVTGPATSTTGNLPTFADNSGKTLSDSGVAIVGVSTAVSQSHTHANSAVLGRLGEDNDGDLTLDGTKVSDGKVECVVLNAGDSVPSNLRTDGVIFEVQTGA